MIRAAGWLAVLVAAATVSFAEVGAPALDVAIAGLVCDISGTPDADVLSGTPATSSTATPARTTASVASATTTCTADPTPTS